MIEANNTHFEGHSLELLGKKMGLLRACIKPGAAGSHLSTMTAESETEWKL